MKDSEKKKGSEEAGSSSPRDNLVPAPKRKRTAYQYVPTEGTLPAPTSPMLFRDDRVSDLAAKTALQVPPPTNNPSSSGLEEKNTTQESPIKKLAGDGSHMKQQARNSKEAGTSRAASRRIGNLNVAGRFFDPAEASSNRTSDNVAGGGMVEIGTWDGLQINMEELHNSDNNGLLLPDYLVAKLYMSATRQEIDEMATEEGLEVVALDEDGREYSMWCRYTNNSIGFAKSGGDKVEGLVLKADWAAFARAHGGPSVQFNPNAKSTDGSLLIKAFRHHDGRLRLVFLFKKPQGGADDQ